MDGRPLRLLSDYTATHTGLLVKCRRCRREVEIPVKDLAAQFGPATLLERVEAILSCQHCPAPTQPEREALERLRRFRPRLTPVLREKPIPIQGAFGGAYSDYT